MDKYINKIKYKNQYKILNEVLKILHDNNIFYLPVGGTQLGLHRDNCILPYDDDFDFIIHKKDREKIINLMINNNYYIYYPNYTNKAFAVLYKNINFHDDKYVFIDFFEAEIKNNKLESICDIVNCNEKCVLNKSFDNIPQINIMCDEHIEDYLNNKYKDWKTKYIILNHHTKGQIILDKPDVPNLLELSNQILKN